MISLASHWLLIIVVDESTSDIMKVKSGEKMKEKEREKEGTTLR